jgi:hypothetical protein
VQYTFSAHGQAGEFVDFNPTFQQLSRPSWDCFDGARSDLNQEYLNRNYPAYNGRSVYDATRFLPRCTGLTKAGPSSGPFYFTNSDSRKKLNWGSYEWAPVRIDYLYDVLARTQYNFRPDLHVDIDYRNIRVESGFRNPARNSVVGSSPKVNGRHQFGDAADIKPWDAATGDMNPLTWQRLADAASDAAGGTDWSYLELYECPPNLSTCDASKTHVHIDLRKWP